MTFDFTNDEQNILACFNAFNGTSFTHIKDITSGTTYVFPISSAVMLVAANKLTQEGIKTSNPYDYLNVAMLTDTLRRSDRLDEIKANVVTPIFKPES